MNFGKSIHLAFLILIGASVVTQAAVGANSKPESCAVDLDPAGHYLSLIEQFYQDRLLSIDEVKLLAQQPGPGSPWVKNERFHVSGPSTISGLLRLQIFPFHTALVAFIERHDETLNREWGARIRDGLTGIVRHAESEVTSTNHVMQETKEFWLPKVDLQISNGADANPGFIYQLRGSDGLDYSVVVSTNGSAVISVLNVHDKAARTIDLFSILRPNRAVIIGDRQIGQKLLLFRTNDLADPHPNADVGVILVLDPAMSGMAPYYQSYVFDKTLKTHFVHSEDGHVNFVSFVTNDGKLGVLNVNTMSWTTTNFNISPVTAFSSSSLIAGSFSWKIQNELNAFAVRTGAGSLSGLNLENGKSLFESDDQVEFSANVSSPDKNRGIVYVKKRQTFNSSQYEHSFCMVLNFDPTNSGAPGYQRCFSHQEIVAAGRKKLDIFECSEIKRVFGYQTETGEMRMLLNCSGVPSSLAVFRLDESQNLEPLLIHRISMGHWDIKPVQDINRSQSQFQYVAYNTYNNPTIIDLSGATIDPIPFQASAQDREMYRVVTRKGNVRYVYKPACGYVNSVDENGQQFSFAQGLNEMMVPLEGSLSAENNFRILNHADRTEIWAVKDGVARLCDLDSNICEEINLPRIERQNFRLEYVEDIRSGRHYLFVIESNGWVSKIDLASRKVVGRLRSPLRSEIGMTFGHYFTSDGDLRLWIFDSNNRVAILPGNLDEVLLSQKFKGGLSGFKLKNLGDHHVGLLFSDGHVLIISKNEDSWWDLQFDASAVVDVFEVGAVKSGQQNQNKKRSQFFAVTKDGYYFFIL